MLRRRHLRLCVLVAIGPMLTGCAAGKKERHAEAVGDVPLPSAQLQLEEPCVDAGDSPESYTTAPPLALGGPQPPRFRDLRLEEAIQLALANSPVLRDVGGRVLRDPLSVRTMYEPALADTDPRFGVEAALSAFDASFATSLLWENNDRALNNIFEGGGTRLFQQDVGLYNFELRKRSAVGTQMALRHVLDYDFNNAPGNNVPNLPWGAWVEGEVRQPLLRGAGVDFNRIAGPESIPGVSTGVLVARINTDVALADFEANVHELVSNVENAYWELYFAYRDLDAKMAARQRALDTWREVHTYFVTGRLGGAADQEAQAREQYFRLEAEVQTALAGKVAEKTSANVFRGTGGVYYLERRLRLTMGLAANDGDLLRPTDEPSLARVVFDWEEIVRESLARRVELRKQKWIVRRRELEMTAAEGFLLPQLDAIARYRFRGLGHDLLATDRTGRPDFDNAYMNLTGGEFQEWMLGVEMTVPLGFRRELNAVRNAELRLARERAVLREQEREVVNDLSSVYAECRRAYQVAQTNFNRRVAAYQQLEALKAIFVNADENEKVRLLDLLLDAQRRLADAESQYFRSLAEYAFAIKNVNYEKGSLLDYYAIHLAEGPWPGKAYYDAQRREQSRHGPLPLGHLVHRCPPIVTQGPIPQAWLSAEPHAEPAAPMPAAKPPEPAPEPPGQRGSGP